MTKAPDDRPAPHSAQKPCRSCGNPIDSSDANYPFCSDRCRLVDLGAWFNESYRMSRPLDEVDELD